MKNRWSLVVHEVTVSSVCVWFGTLFYDLRKPFKTKVTLFDKNKNMISEQVILRDEWDRPFSKIKSQRFYKLLEFGGLNTGENYWIKAIEIFEEPKLEEIELTAGTFTTLPNSVNDLDDGFTVAIGSCFYEEHDGGKVGLSYQTLIHSEKPEYKPHIKFLTGDQVYLDIGWDSLSVIPKEIRGRIADDYALHWQALRGMHRNGGTWFVADDHEFWNNYPHVKGISPFIQALRIKSVKRAWKGTAMDGVTNVQRSKPVRTFNIGNEVSFCIVDLRAFRTKRRILPKDDLKSVCDWIANLSNPGILVLSQPLMDKKGGKSDLNFASYGRDYKVIVKAIHDANHDILTLSGDVHYSKVSSVSFHGRENKLHEVVSSPLSNLSGLGGLATNCITKSSRLKQFPAIEIEGIEKTNIQYQEPWRVSTSFSIFDLRYPRRRTKENFFTLKLNKLENGKLSVEVKAWLVREKNRQTGLPKQNWRKPVQFEMK
jgi:phosphodiesterase/alkaline phosphatase D-like protein